jgi:hypothetical protein
MLASVRGHQVKLMLAKAIEFLLAAVASCAGATEKEIQE